ncbi:hypothetical protein SLE2022_335250 [Rubroshorea leprosula]
MALAVALKIQVCLSAERRSDLSRPRFDPGDCAVTAVAKSLRFLISPFWAIFQSGIATSARCAPHTV